jgi:hypothetical protein
MKRLAFCLRTELVRMALVCAAVAIWRSPLQAAPVVFDPDGLAPTNGAVTIGSFGYDTANALAQASIAGGTFVAPGTTFQLFFQTRLSNLTLTPGGATVTPAGLNGTAGGPAFEDTLVGSVTEIVTSVSAGGNPTFAVAPVQNPLSYIRMFYHPGLISDHFTGANFATGTQILAATPTAALPSSGNFTKAVGATGAPIISPFDTFDPPASVPGVAYAGVTSVVGSGGTIIGGIVNSTDPNFFQTPVVSIRLDAFNDLAFAATTPSQFFNSFANTPTIPANRGAINGVSGPDFQLETRTAASFDVPEPASTGLLLAGIVGILGRRSRRW